MAPPAKGSAATFYIVKEVTRGVDPGTGYLAFPAASLEIGETQPQQPPDLLGLGRDQDRREPDVVTTEGSVRLPIDRRIIGHWLTMALGEETTSNNDPVIGTNTHTWKSGKDILPSYTIVNQMPDVTPVRHTLGLGIQMNSFSLRLEPTGRLYFEGQLQGNSFSLKQSSHGLSGATTLVFERMSQIETYLELNDAQIGKVTYMSLNFSNNNEVVRYVGDQGNIGDVLPGLVDVSGEVAVLYHPTEHDALFTLVNNRTTFKLAALIKYGQDDDQQLQFIMNQAEFTKPSIPVSSPSGIQATFPFTATANTSIAGSALEVKLMTPVSGY